MDAEGNGSAPSRRGPLEQALLAALGWTAQTAEGVDELIDDLARRVGVDRDAMHGAVRDAVTAWRREGERAGARRESVVEGLATRAGLAQQAEVDDLSLRVAQLEHRLKLLERD